MYNVHVHCTGQHAAGAASALLWRRPPAPRSYVSMDCCFCLLLLLMPPSPIGRTSACGRRLTNHCRNKTKRDHAPLNIPKSCGRSAATMLRSRLLSRGRLVGRSAVGTQRFYQGTPLAPPPMGKAEDPLTPTLVLEESVRFRRIPVPTRLVRDLHGLRPLAAYLVIDCLHKT